MADISLNSIFSLLSGNGVSAISKRTKLKNSEVANVLTAAVPILLTGMKRNSGNKAGEASLRGALSDHSMNVTNAGDFLKTADLKDGKKILGHVLGNDQKSIVDRVSKASGVSAGKTTTILALIAPLLLSLLGNQQSQQGSGFNLLGLLGGMLGGGQQQQQQQSASLLGTLLGGGAQQQQPQQQSSSLLGGLFGGGQSQQQNDLLLPVQQNTQQNQQAQQGGSVLEALGGLGGLSSLFGNSEQEQPQQQDNSGDLLDGFLNLFR